MCYNFGMCFSFFKGYMPPRKTYGKKNMKLANCEVFEKPQQGLKFSLKKTQL